MQDKAVIRCLAASLTCLVLCICLAAKSQTTYSGIDFADSFLATGSASNPEGADLTGLNFGSAGALVVAPAASVKGEFQSILAFGLTNALEMFNAAYGTDNWTVTGISLILTSNYGTAGVQPNNGIFPVISGGNFAIEWLATNGWPEGSGTPNLPTTVGVTYDSLPALLACPHEILGIYTFTPPGDNVPVTYPLPLTANLVSNVMGGGAVTFLFYAADGQIGYIFNSYFYGRGNEPLIQITAAPKLKILSGNFTNGVFHLTGIGGSNVTYQVQANSDLTTTNWQGLGSVAADSAGSIQFDDVTATNHSQRFYRLSK